MGARTGSAARETTFSRRAAIALVPLLGCACTAIAGLGDPHLRSDEEPVDAGVVEDGSAGDGPTGAPKPVVLASGRRRPTAIRADGTSLYWIEEADGEEPGAVVRIDRAGGTPVVLAPARQRPTGLRVDSTTVFFTDDRVPPDGGDFGLFGVPKAGGAVTLVDRDDYGFGAVGLFGDYVLTEAWSGDGGTKIRRSAKSGPPASATCYGAAGVGRFPWISENQTLTYFIDSGAGAIMRTDFDCDSDTTVFAASQPAARRLTRDDGWVYWTTDHAVLRLAIADPGGTPQVLASGLKSPGGIWVLKGPVFFTDEGDGTVQKIASGKVTVVASGQGGPRAIVGYGSNAIYWTNHDSGEIVALSY